VHSISYTPVTDPRTEPEALIKEARQRQRRRRLAGAVAVVVTAAAAAVTAAGLIAGSGSGDRTTPSPSPRTEPTAPARAAALVTVSETRLPKGGDLSLVSGFHAIWVTGIGVTYEVDDSTGSDQRHVAVGEDRADPRADDIDPRHLPRRVRQRDRRRGRRGLGDS